MQGKNIAFGITIAGLIVGFFYFILRLENFFSITNYPPREGGIVAFGDSLVYGTGSENGRDFVSFLAEMIGEPIENLGYPGDTTENGLMRIDRVIEKHPRIVLLLLGGNDYLGRIPKEKTFKNLDTIISRLHDDGTIVVLLGVRGGIVLDHFDTEFEELAKRKRVTYVPDVLDGLFGNSKFMSDQIHPNDLGYKMIAEKIYPVLSPVLR